MPSFTYSARDKAGAAVRASIEAASRRDALRLLGARGLRVSSISEENPSGASPRPRSGEAVDKPRAAAAAISSSSGEAVPKRRERLPFLEALHDLTASGLSASEAVRLLSVRLKDPALRVLCQGLWERISEGAALSGAMAAYPAVFDTSTVNLIAAGETTGSLNDTLVRLIAHLTEQRELQRQLLSELAYPAFMFLVAGGVILFFLFFLLPRMQTLLTSLGGKLPISTQILVGLSQFALHYGLIIVGVGVFAVISFWRWRATEPGRLKSDAWLLRVPFLGPFITSQTVLAISQTLSVLLENGITTAEALKMTERQISNLVHRSAFGIAITRVLEGEALSLALARTKCFPDLVLDRLAVGENTGNVVPSLKDIAKNYRLLLSRELQGITRVLASAVMAAVFMFVGFIAFAIISAVFQMSASFSKMH